MFNFEKILADTATGKDGVYRNEDQINKKIKDEINHHDLRVYKPHHRLVRGLKRIHSPSCFGYRVWKTSWMLIDYLKQTGLPNHLNVLEIGCGWGLPGIFCARNYHATVTCLDTDSEVFPFLQLHARANLSQITTINSGFEVLTPDYLSQIDLLIGAEICFWDDMADRLANLIGSALKSGVRQILIADPGRPPFDTLVDYCQSHYHGRAVTWRIYQPYQFQGLILRIGSMGKG